MGKASKWILNFLVGKQEKRINETNFSVSNSNDHHPSAAATKPAGTPKVKRRWSFGKLAGKAASQRFSKCVDSIDTEKLDLKTQQNHALALAKITRDIENASATRIQSAFRSHLARKALHALKGLVKLQALIRGHIVRKETAATIMRMQALMAIQVRARYKRIQMAEEAQQANKKQMNIQRKTINLNPDDRRLSESTSGHLNHSYRNTTFYSDHHLSNSKQHPFEESFFLIANSPSNSSVASSKPKPARSSTQEYVDPACHDYTFKPNYMSNTKSSKAKVRSHSEPKQRPESNMKHKTTKPVDETLAPMEDHVLKRSSSRFIPNGHKNHDPRFVKLYRSKRLFEDNKHASVSHTNYNESLAAAYELIDRQF